ncbi:MAG: acyl-CoA dehydrogenase family protein [Gammaproteobacteria bacterium]
MNFQNSAKVSKLAERLEKFMDAHIYPVEQSYRQAIQASENRWVTPALMNELKDKARKEDLWNLFLPDDEHGAGLGNLEYAPLAEIMGRVLWSSEVFNCSAPDTGNMEVLAQYGSQAQKEQWLTPLLNGEIRSAFAMTEPAVASSDATNIECSIVADGDEYLINGRKWFITGAMHENCRVLIVMGKTGPDNPDRHRQQSMILVPMDTPGVKVERPLTTLGYDDPPFGHAELSFTDVRVPGGNLILGEGRGFEIAQGRLGPGRIHHCMRLVGLAQRALEAMCRRAEQRVAFGKKLSEQGSVREDIAKSGCEIDQARLLTLKAADTMDREGNKAARNEIAMIKIVAPTMACEVLDRAIQIHGAAGLHDDLFLSEAYTYARQIRLADGPDQVHMNALGRWLVREHN